MSIAIAGCGPAGLALAMLLAKQGKSVQVTAVYRDFSFLMCYPLKSPISEMCLQCCQVFDRRAAPAPEKAAAEQRTIIFALVARGIAALKEVSQE